MNSEAPLRAAWRDDFYRVIFESDTPFGKAFDIVIAADVASLCWTWGLKPEMN